MSDAERIPTAVAEFQKTQTGMSCLTDFENAIDLQQQLLSQLTESREVKKVFKRLGPALLPQDHGDAKENVNKRVEFIEKELFVHADSERVEGHIKDLSVARDKLRTEARVY